MTMKSSKQNIKTAYLSGSKAKYVYMTYPVFKVNKSNGKACRRISFNLQIEK